MRKKETSNEKDNNHDGWVETQPWISDSKVPGEDTHDKWMGTQQMFGSKVTSGPAPGRQHGAHLTLERLPLPWIPAKIPWWAKDCRNSGKIQRHTVNSYPSSLEAISVMCFLFLSQEHWVLQRSALPKQACPWSKPDVWKPKFALYIHPPKILHVKQDRLQYDFK